MYVDKIVCFILFSFFVLVNIFLILLEELYIFWLLKYSEVILVNILKFKIFVFLLELFISVVRWGRMCCVIIEWYCRSMGGCCVIVLVMDNIILMRFFVVFGLVVELIFVLLELIEVMWDKRRLILIRNFLLVIWEWKVWFVMRCRMIDRSGRCICNCLVCFVEGCFCFCIVFRDVNILDRILGMVFMIVDI